MKLVSRALLALVAIVLLVIVTCTFVVDQRQHALVLAFGKPQDPIVEPGLHFKLPPPFNNVEFFDKRILPLESDPSEVLAKDQRRIVVDAFARWKIVDPLKFYQTVRTESLARQRLQTILDSSIKEVVGDVVFDEVLKKRAELMQSITRDVGVGAKEFGVEIVDVRIRSADLPQQNLLATYERMKTERQREAADFRARGEEAKQIKQAEADRRSVELTSEARRKSAIIKGEADAAAAKTFADAFGKDPEFYNFYRSLIAYETALDGGNSSIVMSPNSDFFEYLRDENGASGKN
jgi:membrane protease subunit HflC